MSYHPDDLTDEEYEAVMSALYNKNYTNSRNLGICVEDDDINKVRTRTIMESNMDTLIREAYKNRNDIALNAYRNIKAEFQKVQTSKNAPEWNEALELQIISKYAKKLEDSISQFSEACRDDLIAEYTSELEVVRKLLPEPINESQIYQAINEWENLNGYFVDPVVVHNIDSVAYPIPKKDMGTVIKHVKSKFPTADGKMISKIVKKYII